jgi:hypothetical protein
MSYGNFTSAASEGVGVLYRTAFGVLSRRVIVIACRLSRNFDG